jgi:hypothetical protein
VLVGDYLVGAHDPAQVFDEWPQVARALPRLPLLWPLAEGRAGSAHFTTIQSSTAVDCK